MRVALVSREVFPLGGGGIGRVVNAAASVLSAVAEVTIVTTSNHQRAYERLLATRDPGLPPGDVRVAFVREPTDEEAAPWSCHMHLYSALVYERLQELYPGGGPDLIEFPDFLGEGFVSLQAADALDPFLADTRIVVRLHTTAEMCNVLDGHLEPGASEQATRELERFSLARADRLLWGGGDVLGAYQRFYGRDALAPATRTVYPYRGPQTSLGADAAYEPGEPLRILYLGRLERRKGVHHLIRAATGMRRPDFRLTLVGGDTDTGPLGSSMREQLTLAIAADARISLHGDARPDLAAAAVCEHDVVIVPSLWECWPYVALEALALNRPLAATPVGGLVEQVRAGQSGWLASGTGPVAIEELLGTVLDARDELATMVRSGSPSAVSAELTEAARMLDQYQSLARMERRRVSAASVGRRAGQLPLVSAIVPYFRASEFVAETVQSLLAQSYPRLEIVLVNDGSFEDADWIIAELAARAPLRVVSQMNAGLGAARNFGVLQSSGRYFLPLDADNTVAPDFVARAVEILESRPEVAYVTSWSRYIDPAGTPRQGHGIGYEPIGNQAALNAEQNVAGDAAALIRRRLFDIGFRYSEELTSFEDWHLYRELQLAGQFGAVIPERLLSYRVRDDSMQAVIAAPNRARLLGEIEALIRENGMRWTSSNV